MNYEALGQAALAGLMGGAIRTTYIPPTEFHKPPHYQPVDPFESPTRLGLRRLAQHIEQTSGRPL